MPNSTPSSKSPDTSLLIKVRGCGNLVSFKNTKMIARGRLITDPKKQAKMEQYIHAIISNLLSMYPTIAQETATGCLQQFVIASSMPADDSWQWIPEISVRVVKVAPGEEGCDILLTRLDTGAVSAKK